MIFHVTMHPEEDGWIVVECPALPGCVSQGRTQQEAMANIREAITGWLWAEDQKALDGLPKGSVPVLVAVQVGTLANVSGKEAVKVFERAGWAARGQIGSHVMMTKPGLRVNLSVPQHKELAPGTLRSLIRLAGISVDEFLALL